MRVLVLSPYPDLITNTIKIVGDEPIIGSADLELDNWPDADWIISFGYRKIIPQSRIEKMHRRIINIHPSALPYNRGASPNFWSWFDDTPKGISIHYVDKGIDTGELIAMKVIMEDAFRTPMTLTSTYEDLQVLASGMFKRWWPSIRDDKLPPWKERYHPYKSQYGSLHKNGDKDIFFSRLSAGYGTSVNEVKKLGLIYRMGIRDQT